MERPLSIRENVSNDAPLLTAQVATVARKVAHKRAAKVTDVKTYKKLGKNSFTRGGVSITSVSL